MKQHSLCDKVRNLTPIKESNFGISRSDDLVNRTAEIDVLGIFCLIIGILLSLVRL
jgi:putative ABC transport system permease protein